MLTIWNYVERNLVFFKILYVKNFFLQISHTYSVEVIKYSFKGFFYCIYIHVFIKGRVLPPTFWKLSSAGQSSYLINSRSWVRVPSLAPKARFSPGFFRRCSSMVEYQLPKLTTRVRFPSSAPKIKSRFGGFCFFL